MKDLFLVVVFDVVGMGVFIMGVGDLVKYPVKDDGNDEASEDDL